MADKAIELHGILQNRKEKYSNQQLDSKNALVNDACDFDRVEKKLFHSHNASI